jgi:hypothetical protein
MLNLPRPKLDGEKPTIRNAPATEELKEFVQSLAARAERLKNGRVDPSEDNMLKITSEGRKAALDLRLMKPAAPDEPQGKVNLAVEKIFNIWQESKPERSAQLVFCDLSTPKDKGFSVYNDMAQKLEKLGIPSSEIAFIQDYDSDVSKLTLFRDVRSGKVRVLFGSTQKMGSGTNVQERLIALHHLDAPWRPADVEQREGRILRQGNKNAVVQVFRYVTEGNRRGMIGQASQFIARQKLCNSRNRMLVLTVPAFMQARSCSACVSMMTSRWIRSNAFCRAPRRQRSWVVPRLYSMMALKASCQVRVEIPESVPARYAFAIWRLSCGCRTASLRALSRAVASARFLVPVLSCLWVSVSST